MIFVLDKLTSELHLVESLMASSQLLFCIKICQKYDLTN